MPVVVALLLSVSAVAKPVYKCEEKGKITYTDQPCAPGAAVAKLPGLIVTTPPTASQRDLARAHDQRLAKARAERDRDDAEWLKQHANRKDRDARVRKAILEHRVIKSMTFDEVEQALGKPDEVQGGDSFGTSKTTWVYLKDGQRRVVNFKDGEVTTTTGRGRKQK
ncbi:MAG: DUF4124 domain-containing protein [Gammaproteobacteria bacterium]